MSYKTNVGGRQRRMTDDEVAVYEQFLADQLAVAWKAVRQDRDRLLSDSDWTQIADAPVDAAVWAAYRQQLRDIPQTFDDPDQVVWPEEP